MAFAENLREFVSTDDFAVTAIINGSIQVPVILDEQYVDPLGMSAAATAVQSLVEDWMPRRGDVVDIDGRRWTVESNEPDGTGFQVSRLKVVS